MSDARRNLLLTCVMSSLARWLVGCSSDSGSPVSDGRPILDSAPSEAAPEVAEGDRPGDLGGPQYAMDAMDAMDAGAEGAPDSGDAIDVARDVPADLAGGAVDAEACPRPLNGTDAASAPACPCATLVALAAACPTNVACGGSSEDACFSNGVKAVHERVITGIGVALGRWRLFTPGGQLCLTLGEPGAGFQSWTYVDSAGQLLAQATPESPATCPLRFQITCNGQTFDHVPDSAFPLLRRPSCHGDGSCSDAAPP